MHKSQNIGNAIALRTAKLESREVIRLEERLQTKIFNERRFSPAGMAASLLFKYGGYELPFFSIIVTAFLL